MDLHADHARELMDVGLLLEGLRTHFEDETTAQVAEGELVASKQRGTPAKDYVKEYRRLASRVHTWPERMLVHHFHLGLDRELRQACLYRGLPLWLSEWFRVAIDLDVGLRELWTHPPLMPLKRGLLEKPRGAEQIGSTPGSAETHLRRPPL